jgi:hypothetical protein
MPIAANGTMNACGHSGASHQHERRAAGPRQHLLGENAPRRHRFASVALVVYTSRRSGSHDRFVSI